MSSVTVLDRLRRLEATLRAAGVQALYLFGSTARAEATDLSDVDLLFEADPARRFSLIDQAQLQLDLSATLGRPVDFIERRSLFGHVRERTEAEMVRVF
jgi:predicted nucleotidyltransferase